MKPHKFISTAVLFLVFSLHLKAQDPKLPPNNLGLTNLQDGNPPGPGWYFQQFIQNYQVSANHGPLGENADGPKINFLLSMSQIIWISNHKLAGGNFGFTLLVPVVRFSVSGTSMATFVNSNPLGDIISGPFVQWFHRHLLGMPFSSRLEVDLTSPVGAFRSSDVINPGSHLFSITPHYAFTLSPTDRLSLSMRHHFNYDFNQLGTAVKPGISYNFNYAVEYRIDSALRVEIAGYYLKQLQQDSQSGNTNYFQAQLGIPDTRERVFAYGPGLGYLFPTGLAVELKGMRESATINRPEGFRTTLVLTYKLDKKPD